MASRSTRLHINPQQTAVRRCTSMKRGYANYNEALDAAELMMLNGAVNQGCHITPYECPECSEWHVANRVIVPIGRKWRQR